MAIKFTTEDKLVVAVSSRALFDLESEHKVYTAQGAAAYQKLTRQRINRPARPGVAFAFVQKLMALNNGRDDDERVVECVVISRCDPSTSLRVFNSLSHYGLDQICCGANTNGRDPLPYVDAYNVDLFLTADERDARAALVRGRGAALVYPRRGSLADPADHEIRLAYDFDGVLGSDESERITHAQGLPAYLAHEDKKCKVLMPPGPFKRVAQSFNTLRQRGFAVRTAVITARLAPHDERVLRTARHWGVEIDEIVRTGSEPKAAFVRAFNADLFAEDTPRHAQGAALHVLTGHVVAGIKNS